MASITIGSLVLQLASNLAVGRFFPSLSKLDPAPVVNGSVREYAGGRSRVVTSPGSKVTLAVSIAAVSRADVQWLESIAGQVILSRDSTGRKFWGVYFAPVIHEYPAALNVADVDLSIEQVTYSEIV